MSRKKLFSKLTKNNDIFTKERTLIDGMEKIPTPSPSLNVAIGGGFPVGYMFQLAGEPSGGKSFLSFVMAKQWQEHFGDKSIVLIADFEHSITRKRLQDFDLNVDDESLYIWKRADNSGAEFFDFLNESFLPMCKQEGLKPFVILDSKDAMLPPSEMNRSSSELEMGAMAKFLKRVLKRSVGNLADVGGSMVIINQIVERIGVMYGDPKTTSGGNALKHNSILDIWVYKADSKKDLIHNTSGVVIGHRVRFAVKKNKTFFPNQKGSMYILYKGKMVAHHVEIFNMVKERGVVERPTPRSWHVDPDDKTLQFGSKREFIEAIKNMPGLAEKMIERCEKAAHDGGIVGEGEHSEGFDDEEIYKNV